MSRPPATVRCDSIREACLRSFHTFIAPPLEPTGTGCERNESAKISAHASHIRLWAYDTHAARRGQERMWAVCRSPV